MSTTTPHLPTVRQAHPASRDSEPLLSQTLALLGWGRRGFFVSRIENLLC